MKRPQRRKKENTIAVKRNSRKNKSRGAGAIGESLGRRTAEASFRPGIVRASHRLGLALFTLSGGMAREKKKAGDRLCLPSALLSFYILRPVHAARCFPFFVAVVAAAWSQLNFCSFSPAGLNFRGLCSIVARRAARDGRDKVIKILFSAKVDVGGDRPRRAEFGLRFKVCGDCY